MKPRFFIRNTCYARTGKEIIPEVIHPPAPIKPDINPAQRFRLAPQDVKPSLFFPARHKRISQQEKAEPENRHLAKRKRNHRRHSRKHRGKHRIYFPCIPLSRTRYPAEHPHAHQKQNQHRPTNISETHVFHPDKVTIFGINSLLLRGNN